MNIDRHLKKKENMEIMPPMVGDPICYEKGKMQTMFSWLIYS